MTKEENTAFIKKTESLVKPQDVTAISFLGDFNKLLPAKLQQRIMEKGGSKVPYMGFIVDPYCLFLAYEIKDIDAAQTMLPEEYELAEASLFSSEKTVPLVIFSAFSARTSAFMGTRLECYVIARYKKTGRISWIIIDYTTNTNSHDPKNGFCGYTSDPTVFTTTPYGELLVDVAGIADNQTFSVEADLNHGEMEELNENLWVEGNMSVDYGGVLKAEGSTPFSLIFDPFLMKEARHVPLDRIHVGANTFLQGLIDNDHPISAAVFPFSQHFIIRQDLQGQVLTREQDLFDQIHTFLRRTDFKTMSGDDLKKPLFRGFLISSLVNLGIILFLLIKVFG